MEIVAAVAGETEDSATAGVGFARSLIEAAAEAIEIVVEVVAGIEMKTTAGAD